MFLSETFLIIALMCLLLWKEHCCRFAEIILLISMCLVLFDKIPTTDLFVYKFKWAFLRVSIAFVGTILCYIHDNADEKIAILFAVLGAMLAISTVDFSIIVIASEIMTIAICTLLCHDEAKASFFIYACISETMLIFAICTIYFLTGMTNFHDARYALSFLGRDHEIASFASIIIMISYAIKVALFPCCKWLQKNKQNKSVSIFCIFLPMNSVVLYRIISEVLCYIALDTISVTIGILSLFAGAIYLRNAINMADLLFGFSVYNAGVIFIINCAHNVNCDHGMIAIIITEMCVFLGLYLLGINSKNDTILLESLQSLGHVSAQQGLCITLLLLCLISFPPFLGFWGVFYICSALLESKFLWTTIVYAITSVVSAMFILKTIASIWRIEKADSMISVNYKLTYILYLITFTAIIVLPIVYGMNNIFNMSNYESV